MSELSALEAALLQIVNEGRGEYSWYAIVSHLSDMDVPRDPDAMVALKELARCGLLRRHVNPGSPQDKWEITSIGLEALQRRLADEDK
ncbi:MULTISPECIES: hypothetical protein [Sorangium]|uniref:Transcription regulator PadR N-terminal domain-containing protein n=1 Tax=Sorangium cellulosum TaxID=56 RepID=A0A4P2QZZ3_SORCE|nr:MULTISPECIES: hypothetical protein [Sorangium]AUX35896.1 hypothetical protein SOCE836_080980 [Sorangium cellulosum]